MSGLGIADTTQRELVDPQMPNDMLDVPESISPRDEWVTTDIQSLASKSSNSIVGGPFGSELVSKDYADQGVPVIRGSNMGGHWISGDFVFVSESKADSLRGCLRRG